MEEGDDNVIINNELTADVAQVNLIDPIVIAEDDENSHVLVVSLMVNGEPLDVESGTLPSARSVKLHYKRADGQTGSVTTDSYDDNVLRFELPDAMLALDDMVICDIVVSYSKQVTIHALSVVGDQLVVTPTTQVSDCPLRSALFYIDSQLRVITGQGGNQT